MNRRTPYNKNYLVNNISSVKVKKPWLRGSRAQYNSNGGARFYHPLCIQTVDLYMWHLECSVFQGTIFTSSHMAEREKALFLIPCFSQPPPPHSHWFLLFLFHLSLSLLWWMVKWHCKYVCVLFSIFHWNLFSVLCVWLSWGDLKVFFLFSSQL